MRFSISNICECIAKRQRTLRSLDSCDLKFQPDGVGGLKCYAGNCTVVFPVEFRGEPYALRCYMQPKDHLREIYGDRYYPDELEGLKGGSADIVLTPWVEGQLLTTVVEKYSKEQDQNLLRTLSHNFNLMAEKLLSETWAHGDLSGDNIIVSEDLTLHFIDFDSCYLPEIKGMKRTEVGNSNYQSPFIRDDDFNKHIDDYPIAIIATSLKALSYAPSLKEQFRALDSLLINAIRCTDENYPLLPLLQNLFAEKGDFVAYEMCQAIRSCNIVIKQLPNLLRFQNASCNESPHLQATRSGRLERWGYEDPNSGEMMIPQMFDYASDFKDDRALVRIDKWWYFINRQGQILKPLGYLEEYPKEYDTM